MGLARTTWLIALGAIVVGAASAASLWTIRRSPVLAEWFTGLDAERHMIVPRANKNDRLERPDSTAIVARWDEAEMRRLGRPSVEAVWAARMTLPSPAEWLRQSSPPAPVDPAAPLTYAAARAVDPPTRDPFRIIDEGPGSTPEAPSASVPLPMPRPVIEPEEDEEDEEEAEFVPLPLPRPRNIPPVPSVAAVPPPPPERPAAPQAAPVPPTPPAAVAAAPPAAAPAPESAAPAAPPPQRSAVPQGGGSSFSDNPMRDNMDLPPLNPGARTQVAAVAPTTREAEPEVPRRSGPTLMTPFGVPYTLQHASVETQCFPPQLVELLRRLERAAGGKPIVTSGYRTRGRSGSLHRRCLAADIMIPGVSSTELARIARTVPGMGGVGQYCHPNLVHVDIGTARDWKYGCGTFFALREGSSPPASVPVSAGPALGFGQSRGPVR